MLSRARVPLVVVVVMGAVAAGGYAVGRAHQSAHAPTAGILQPVKITRAPAAAVDLPIAAALPTLRTHASSTGATASAGTGAGSGTGGASSGAITPGTGAGAAGTGAGSRTSPGTTTSPAKPKDGSSGAGPTTIGVDPR